MFSGATEESHTWEASGAELGDNYHSVKRAETLSRTHTSHTVLLDTGNRHAVRCLGVPPIPRFPSITFHRASLIQPPSFSALGHQTHRDQARLLLQQPEHLHRDPPPLKAAPGLELACIQLQNDSRNRKPSQHTAEARGGVPGNRTGN